MISTSIKKLGFRFKGNNLLIKIKSLCHKKSLKCTTKTLCGYFMDAVFGTSLWIGKLSNAISHRNGICIFCLIQQTNIYNTALKMLIIE